MGPHPLVAPESPMSRPSLSRPSLSRSPVTRSGGPFPVWRLAVLCVGALLVLAACGSDPDPGTATPPPATGGPTSEGAVPEPSPDQRARYGDAHQGALALIALGELGAEQGAQVQVRTLGAELAETGRAVGEQVRDAATEAEVVLGDQAPADVASLVEELATRSGARFDEAWLAAARDRGTRAREDAEVVLDSAAPARAGVAELDALVARLEAATG